MNEPTTWKSRMVITPKENGDPRRCVDFQPVNANSARQTHNTESCWTLATSVPAGTKKSVLDVLHGYQSVPIAEEFKEEKSCFFLGEGRIVFVGEGTLTLICFLFFLLL